MPTSRNSSATSATWLPADVGAAALAWRPSRWLAAALAGAGALAACAVLASGVPPAVAWPLAGLALAHGLGSACRYRRQPACCLRWPAGRAPELDGRAMDDVSLHWRGPLAFLRWREGGRTRRLAWWPDTLPPAARRELKLLAQAAADTPATPSMAP